MTGSHKTGGGAYIYIYISNRLLAALL